MLSNTVYIYKNKTQVQISDNVQGRRNKIVYAANLKLHKDVDNDLFFQFKDSDQKRVMIGNKQFKFVMFDERNLERQIVIDLPMTIADASTGAATVTVSEQYLYHIESGKYYYSIVETDLNGNNHPTYVDDNYGVRGIVDVQLGAGPIFRKSVILTTFTGQDATDTTNSLSNVTSDLANLNQNNALHTAIAKFNNYTGDIIVQGTLDNIAQQTTSAAWVNIKTESYTAQTVPATFNWNGVYTAVRFKQVPTAGSLTEIQYRY